MFSAMHYKKNDGVVQAGTMHENFDLYASQIVK